MVEWIIEPLGDAADLDGVLEVDALSFTRPWTRAMYESEFLNRDTSRMYVLRDADTQRRRLLRGLVHRSTKCTSTTSPSARNCAAAGSDRRCWRTCSRRDARDRAPRAPRWKSALE